MIFLKTLETIEAAKGLGDDHMPILTGGRKLSLKGIKFGSQVDKRVGVYWVQAEMI